METRDSPEDPPVNAQDGTCVRLKNKDIHLNSLILKFIFENKVIIKIGLVS